MKRTELTLIAIAILGFIIGLIGITGGSIFKTLSLGLLALIYFYLGFALFNNIRFRDLFKKNAYSQISKLRIFGAIATGMALSVLTIGILFRIMDWEGAPVMLLVGLPICGIITITATVKYFVDKSPYYSGILKRMVPFTIAGIIFTLSLPLPG